MSCGSWICKCVSSKKLQLHFTTCCLLHRKVHSQCMCLLDFHITHWTVTLVMPQNYAYSSTIGVEQWGAFSLTRRISHIYGLYNAVWKPCADGLILDLILQPEKLSKPENMSIWNKHSIHLLFRGAYAKSIWAYWWCVKTKRSGHELTESIICRHTSAPLPNSTVTQSSAAEVGFKTQEIYIPRKQQQ